MYSSMRSRCCAESVSALEARHDPFEGEHVRPPPAEAVPVLDVDALPVRPVQEQVLVLLGQVLPGRVEIDLVAIRDRLDDRLVVAGAADRPRDERTLPDRESRIGDEQVGVDLLLGPEPGTARAGAVRGVEGEDPRLQLRQRDAVIGTSESLAKRHFVAFDEVDRHESFRERDGRLHRLRESRAQVRLHHQPVDDHLDRVLVLLVGLDRRLEQPLLAVHLHPRETIGAHLFEQILVLALAVAYDRRVDGEARPFWEPQDLVDDRLEALARDRPAADRAVRLADPCVEQSQVVVDLGHRAHGRARVP
jgi:hypothetical protein